MGQAAHQDQFPSQLSRPLLQQPPQASAPPWDPRNMHASGSGPQASYGSQGGFSAPQYPSDFPINGSMSSPGIPAYAHVATYTTTHSHGHMPHTQGGLLMRAPEQVVVCAHSHVHLEAVTCGCCRQHVMPICYKETGGCSWLLAGTLCFLGCWPCSWLPFCLDSTKDSVFRCPSCRAELYRIKLP